MEADQVDRNEVRQPRNVLAVFFVWNVLERGTSVAAYVLLGLGSSVMSVARILGFYYGWGITLNLIPERLTRRWWSISALWLLTIGSSNQVFKPWITCHLMHEVIIRLLPVYFAPETCEDNSG